jgi:hypothetical protein
MKTKSLILVLFTGVVTLMISSCSFLRGTGSITTDNHSICSNYSRTEISKLPMALVEDMTSGYISKQKTAIDDSHGINDARMVWFDLETIKKFIYHVENNAKNDTQNPTSSDKLGIRIYYANYPSDSLWKKEEYDNKLAPFLSHPIRKNYGHLHTVVMIPTIRDKNNIDMDFDPTIPITYTNGIENTGNNSTLPISGIAPVAIQAGQSNNIGAQNHGGLFPPHTDPQTDSGIRF